MSMITIDTTNMCSHLQRKLFEEDGQYHSIWIAMQDDPELTVVVRSRQLHIYRNGKKVLVLAGKSAPKIIREDPICELWKLDFAADETENLPPDLKRGVLSEDGIWNLLEDYRRSCIIVIGYPTNNSCL